MKAIKLFIKWVFAKMGYSITHIPEGGRILDTVEPYSVLPNTYSNVVDLEKISAVASSVPGMISMLSGKLMYVLCYFQKELGDVVEVGSWQGRSASFLARATVESRNGNFFAIDHFKGNRGKEHYYVIEKEDLSDLKTGFYNNMTRIGLEKNITLLDMPNDTAVSHLSGKSVRFLFIDGDHTGEGVKKDIDLFFPLLTDGALVVFDDYSKRFPELLEVVDQLLSKHKHYRVMTYANTLVLKYSVTTATQN